MQKWVRLWGAHSVDQGSPGTDHRRRTFLLPLAPALPFPALETVRDLVVLRLLSCLSFRGSVENSDGS